MTRSPFRRLAVPLGAAALATAVAVLALRPAPLDVEVTLDAGRSFQTFAGWEATADLPEDPSRPEWSADADRLFDRVVDDVGITRVRLEIRSGAETRSDLADRMVRGEVAFEDVKAELYTPQNDNDDPFVIDPAGFDFAELDWHVRNTVLPLRKRIEARGGKLTVNLCYVSFRNVRSFQSSPEEYAEFVLATYRHLDETFGFVPDLWEMILEPDNVPKAWSGRDIGLAMAAAGRRLKAAGYSPAFAAPSTTSMSEALTYARDILAVPDAGDDWRELSYHRYKGVSPDALAGIATFAAENGLSTAMLELWFGKADYKVLYQDLVTGGNVAWQGRVVQGLLSNEGGRLVYAPEVRYTRLYFTAIRPGAVRIGAESSDPKRVAPLAVRNPDGGTAVVLGMSGPGEVTLRGLPPGRYGLRWATATEARDDSRPLAVGASGTLTLSLPGAGVLSVVAS